MVTAILVIWFAGIGFSMWALICNEWTYRDRIWLINQACEGRNWERRRTALLRVSYDQHLYSRILLRNPWKLYGEDRP